MQLSLNLASFSRSRVTLLEQIDLAARHGFSGIDFSIEAVDRAMQEMGRRQFEDYLSARNVQLAVFGLPVEWRRDEPRFAEGLEKLKEYAELASILGCTRCCTYILPATDLEPAEWRRIVVRRFSEIAVILDEQKVRFGLEWVGPHHLRAGGANATGANNVLVTMQDTLDLIAEIGTPTVGLLVDSYHCFTTGVTTDELLALRDDQIVHVHLNDAPNHVPVEDVRDGERLLPGDGQINLDGFLNALQTLGYTGYAAVEVLSPNPIADDPDTAALRVRESLRRFGL